MTSNPHEEEALGRVYDSQLLKRLWPFVRPHKKWITVSLVLIPLRGVLEVAPPLIIGAALNFIVEGQVSSDIAWMERWLEPHFGLPALVWLFAEVLFVACALLALEWLRSASMIVLGQKTVADVRRALCIVELLLNGGIPAHRASEGGQYCQVPIAFAQRRRE